MYKKILCVILISLVTTICSCAILQQLIDKPKVEFKGMSLSNIYLFEAVPVFKFKITNSNPMSISVNKVAYKLTINDHKFIKGISDHQVRINAADSGMLELPITFNYVDVFNNTSEFVRSDKVYYHLSGSIGIGPFSIPYEDQGEFRVPVLPDPVLKHVKISKFSSKGASLVFELELENINAFPIDLSALDYSIKLDGRDFIKGIKSNIDSINKNGKLKLKIPLELDFIELGISVYKLLKEPSLNYELSGTMKFKIPKIGSRKFPFYKKGEVSLVSTDL